MTRSTQSADPTDEQPIEFEGPPPPEDRQRGASLHQVTFWLDVAVRCRAKAGQWAYVGRHRASQVTRINRGVIAAFRPAGQYEATSRRADDEDPRARLWVRYVGGQMLRHLEDTELPTTEDTP